MRVVLYSAAWSPIAILNVVLGSTERIFSRPSFSFYLPVELHYIADESLQSTCELVANRVDITCHEISLNYGARSIVLRLSDDRFLNELTDPSLQMRVSSLSYEASLRHHQFLKIISRLECALEGL